MGQLMGIGRIYTTYIEVTQDDPIILGGSFIGPCLNLLLLWQVYAYSTATDRIRNGVVEPIRAAATIRGPKFL